ncbi:serine/threonine-protein phosphatase [Streptomyces sp. RB6PN25]|uniref:Serine/threonine-protein phosphatase n=1 Tax=Streptomyces humicola TaxID=2953240 RepID=A0ABT1Q203_9ACTN|nr:SpoIIE family protein phosphatase [Streptomyces humicola]MCQ4083955.1 serine/threonine-protein phosphatase [Streptomyces humicola]
MQQAAGEPVTEVGTSCLYAGYDPVSAPIRVACAGHPAGSRPGHPARLLDVPIGPPLGLGGLSFEATETDLPDGSTRYTPTRKTIWAEQATAPH